MADAVAPVSYPAIPEPAQSFASLQETCQRLKETVELLTGQRGKDSFSVVEGISELRKTNGRVTARFAEIIEVIVTADSALAQRTTILEADLNISDPTSKIGLTNGRITDVETVRLTASTAFAGKMADINAKIGATGGTGTVQGRITNVESVDLTAGTAFASRMSHVETQIGTSAASLGVVQSSFNGVKVKFGVVGTISGVSSEVFTINGVARNDDVGGIGGLYTIVINGDLLVNGTITATKIGTAAVTNPKIQDFAVSNSDVRASTDTITSDVTLPVTVRNGSRVAIIAVYRGDTTERLSGFNFGNIVINVGGAALAGGSRTMNAVVRVTSISPAETRKVSLSTTVLTTWISNTTGSVDFRAYSDAGIPGGMDIYVTELSK